MEKLNIVEMRHDLGRRAMAHQPAQLPGMYYFILHRRTGKFFAWAYVDRKYAEYALSNILEDWESRELPSQSGYHSREDMDLDWNFKKDSNDCLITAKTF